MLTRIDLQGAWKIVVAGYNVIGKPGGYEKPCKGALLIAFDQSNIFKPGENAMDYMPEEGRNALPITLIETNRHPAAVNYPLPYHITGWRTVLSATNTSDTRFVRGALLTYADAPFQEFAAGFAAGDFQPSEPSNQAGMRVDMMHATRMQKRADAEQAMRDLRDQGNRSRFLDNDDTPAMREARAFFAASPR